MHGWPCCLESIPDRVVRGLAGLILLSGPASMTQAADPTTAPFRLDHNRMLVEAELQRSDGSWRDVLLWIDTGNPDFMLTEELARDLGFDLAGFEDSSGVASLSVAPPTGLRIGTMVLSTDSVNTNVHRDLQWLFQTMHVEANLPSTVLMHYDVVFDYPKSTLTLAPPGSLPHRGERAPASVHRKTGIVQIDGVVGEDSLSFALDNGASYSFVSGDVLEMLTGKHADWPHMTGAVGCANIWGWWPQEPTWPVVRMPELHWGPVRLQGVGIVGLPDFFGGLGLGGWYSLKAARPVAGFLGPNAFKTFRIEIDYANETVYFERGAEDDLHDMEIVGLTIQPQGDGSYRVIGIVEQDGQASVEGIESGDRLIEIDGVPVTGRTMGTIVDRLRGRPGETRTIIVDRDGARHTVTAEVKRFL